VPSSVLDLLDEQHNYTAEMAWPTLLDSNCNNRGAVYRELLLVLRHFTLHVDLNSSTRYIEAAPAAPLNGLPLLPWCPKTRYSQYL
jgi:hypothetical protein